MLYLFCDTHFHAYRKGGEHYEENSRSCDEGAQADIRRL
jgi:hypothetical protein